MWSLEDSRRGFCLEHAWRGGSARLSFFFFDSSGSGSGILVKIYEVHAGAFKGSSKFLFQCVHTKCRVILTRVVVQSLIEGYVSRHEVFFARARLKAELSTGPPPILREHCQKLVSCLSGIALGSATLRMCSPSLTPLLAHSS